MTLHTYLVKKFHSLVGFVVGHLEHYGRILCKQYLDEIVLAGGDKAIGRHLDTTLGVGESHFEERSHQTTGRDIVGGHHRTTRHKPLHGIERCRKPSGIGYCRSLGAKTVHGLSQSRTAEL